MSLKVSFLIRIKSVILEYYLKSGIIILSGAITSIGIDGVTSAREPLTTEACQEQCRRFIFSGSEYVNILNTISDLCGENCGYSRGRAWDRPCAFAGNDMFVIAADKYKITVEDGINEAELKEPPTYHQLLFYKLSEVKARTYTYSGYENYDALPLAYSEKADCDVFAFSEYGEITAGELHYDSETGHLIVLSENGAFELTLDGKIIHSNLEIKLNAGNWAMRQGDARAIKPSAWLQNWQYDAVPHSFYRFNGNMIEKRCIRE